jgi:hypothetical protein
MKESNSIKSQVKLGIKEGVKEALDEIIENIEQDVRNQAQSDLYKNIALCSSVLFFGYLFFILPGTTEDLVSYNWVNQSLIELKVSVKVYLVPSLVILETPEVMEPELKEIL